MIVVKRDSVVVLVNVLCLAGAFALVWTGKTTMREAEHLVLGLALPSALMWRKKALSSPPSADVVVSPSDPEPEPAEEKK